MKTEKRDHFAEVTARIIASLESGVVPWHQPWGFIEPAQNHFSGHKYRGINSLLMLLGNYKTPYFATMKQINDAGGKVKKGTKSTSVYFHDVIFKDANGNKLDTETAKARLKAGDKSISRFPFIRLFPVFNMQDVDGVEVRASSEILGEDNQPIAICNDFITSLNLGDNLRHSPSEGAYFNKAKDFVMMPDLRRFANSEQYYGTLFHELTHWTGHASRLNRPTLTDALKFGDTNYSKEELTAEIGSCFLCNHHGIATPVIEEQAASYIDNWLGVLKKDKKFIWDAAGDAQGAYAYLMEKAA